MLRMLSRGRKAEAAEGDEHKSYKKADLGGPNKMYYNDELKMWVERGKEDEARAEKAKLSAPPPSVGSLSAASSATSLNAMGGEGGAGGGPGQPPNFSRSRGLAGRYVATMPATTNAPAGPAGAAVPAPPTGGKALLPGGAAKLPGPLPGALPGSGPPSFFMPTPAASEVASEGLGGSELGSVSGLSGLDASFPASRSTSQPTLFVPGQPAGARAPAGADDAVSSSAPPPAAGSGGGSSEQQPLPPLAQEDSVGFAGSSSLRASSIASDATGRLPALSGPGNLSFANWQPPPLGSPARGGGALGGRPPLPQQQLQDVQLAQQGSSADMEADAEAEVSSPAGPLMLYAKNPSQQQAEGAAEGAAGASSAGGPPPAANGQPAPTDMQPPYGAGDSGAWDSRPAADPFDFSGGSAAPAAPAAGDMAAVAVEGGDGGWEGGAWQPDATQQQQYGYEGGAAYAQQQQPQDPLAYNAQPDAAAQQQHADPYGAPAEGGAAAGWAGDAAAAAGWQQQQYQQQQQPSADASYAGGYHASYQQQYGDTSAAAANGYYSGYEQQQQPGADALPPVHPELPGISVPVPREGSGTMVSPQAGFPHPGSGGSSRGSRGAGGFRHSMPGSPQAAALGALLPQPPRASAGGLGAQRSDDAAALTVPTPAAAGDASMLYAVRPSSPYARAVSPLSRTSTGIPDGSSGAAGTGGGTGGGGFPIPSPPSNGGAFGARSRSGNMFIPGASAAAAGAAAGTSGGGSGTPWQPGSAGAGDSTQQLPAPAMNGFTPSSAQQQLHGAPPPPAGAPAGWTAAPHAEAAPLHTKPMDAQPSWGQRDSSRAANGPASAAPLPPGGAAFAAAAPSATAAAAKNLRAHPYEQFLAASLAQINWAAHHFKQPGKLNKLLPWEELELEAARREEAARLALQQQADGDDSSSKHERAFWYRQMAHRQKLPPPVAKPSNSEPAAMPSHAAGAGAQYAGAQTDQAPGWQQQQQPWQPQQAWQPHLQQQQHQPAMSCPLTPARAATTGAAGAVAGAAADGDECESTPTSKLAAAGEQQAAAVPAAEAAPVEQEQQQQQGWAAWGAAAGDGQQQQDAAYGDAAAADYWQQQQQQQYGNAGEQYVGYEQQQQQQYYADQQQAAYYDQGQQQQQQPAEQPGLDALAISSGEQQLEQQQAQEGPRPTTWGSPDAEQQQALHAPEVVAAARAARISTSSVGLESQPSTGRVAAAAARHITSAAFDSLLRAHTLAEDADAEAAAVADAADVAEGGAAAAAESATIMDGWTGEDVEVSAIVAAVAVADDAGGSAEPQQQQPQHSPSESGAPLPAVWLRLRGQLEAAAAEAAQAGSLTDEMAQYSEYFMQYGDYVLAALPVPGEAAAVDGEAATSAAAAAGAGEPQQAAAAAAEEMAEFWAEFGELSLKQDLLTSMLGASGLDLDLFLQLRAAAA